jgi:protease I
MAGETLQGMKVAILVTDGFEQVELTEPRKALDQAGADTHVVSPKGDEVRGWNFTDRGPSLPVDLKLDDAPAAGFRCAVVSGRCDQPG